MSLKIYMGTGASEEVAIALSKRLNVPIDSKLEGNLTLFLDSTGLSLVGYGLRYQGDFNNMIRRISDGRLQHEMLVRVSKTNVESPKAIDATAGMGEDAFLLAASGYDVILYEQNKVIAELLRDAMRRAKKSAVLKSIVGRMHLIDDNSIPFLQNNEDSVDLVYLDPMFPSKNKTGKVNKKLQLIQKLESPCTNESALLDAAISSHAKKIIIKRPIRGKYLADVSPNYSVNGKSVRYDCFVLANNG